MGQLRDDEQPTSTASAAPEAPRALGRQLVSDGAAEFLDILPEISGRNVEQDPYPKIAPQPPFALVYAPDRWDVLEGRIVPMLYRLSYNPGSNGVARANGGRPDPTDALAAVERQGHFALPWEYGGVRYLRAYQVGVAVDRRTGAPVKVMSWHTRWEQLYAGSEVIQSDTAGYVAWLAGLLDRGLLPLPRPYVIERLTRFYEQKLQKALQKAGGNDETSRLYRERLEVCLDAQRKLAQPRGAPARAVDVEPDVPGPGEVPATTASDEGTEGPVDDLEPVPPPRKRSPVPR